MTAPTDAAGATRAPLVLVVHPGAELYGSDRVLMESVAAIREQGSRVLVALPGPGPLVELLERIGADVTIITTLVLRKDYLRLRRLPALLWDSVRGVFAGIRLLRRVRPDVVYVNTVTLPLWPPLARLCGIPVLTHVHEAERGAARFIRTLLYLPLCVSTKLIFNSEFSRSVVATVFPRLASRGVTVYNGVEGPPRHQEPRSTLDGPLRALFVGRLSPRKGSDLLLDAARILADQGVSIRVDLLGGAFDGYEWYEEQLRATAQEPELTGTVFIHGFHDEIWPFLAEADVLVVPSRLDEPFGNTAVEGILAQRPVIVSDTSGLREATAGFASAALIPADDAEALAEALAELAAEWQNRRPMAVTDAVLARSQFSPARYRGEIVREVERLIRFRSSPRQEARVADRSESLSRR